VVVLLLLVTYVCLCKKRLRFFKRARARALCPPAVVWSGRLLGAAATGEGGLCAPRARGGLFCSVQKGELMVHFSAEKCGLGV
jgi:hypothetical protein